MAKKRVSKADKKNISTNRTDKNIQKIKNREKNLSKFQEACGILLITLGVLISLALAANSKSGFFGDFIHVFYALTFGKYVTYLVPAILILIGLYPFTIIKRRYIFKISIVLTVIAFIIVSSLGVYNEYSEQLLFTDLNYAEYIGHFGFLSTKYLIQFTGVPGSFILLSGLTLMLLIFAFDFKILLVVEILLFPVTMFYYLFKTIQSKLNKRKIKQRIMDSFSKTSLDDDSVISKELEDVRVENKDNPDSLVSEDCKKREEENQELFSECEKIPDDDDFTDNVNSEIDVKESNNFNKVTKPRISNKKLQIEKQVVEEEIKYKAAGKVINKYRIPPVELLEEAPLSVNNAENEEALRQNAEMLKEKLNEFSIEADVVQINPGPVITQYEIKLAPGVLVKKVSSLDKDLAMALRARSIRIVAPIPGKDTIGIELPNAKPSIVRIKSIINSEKFIKSKSKLTIALGKTISGETYVLDLAKTPHLLIAGSTGSGKSVCINGIIMSILYRCTPAEVQFCMIDPKKVELSVYADLVNHHLLQVENIKEPVITDPQDAVRLLNALVVEMEERYELLKQTGTRKLDEYNELIESGELTLNPETADPLKKMPYIVCIVDEYGDLMMTSGKAVEDPIIRLAQMARAVGIHMIIATQRPSVKVVTGIIKANFPTRIAFRVMSFVDSKTIVDGKGADSLLGKGDMLIVPPGEADLYRLQNALVETRETSKVVAHIKNQPQNFEKIKIVAEREEQEVDLTDFELSDEFSSMAPRKNSGKRDAYYEEAKKMIIQNQMASVSMLQRGLSIGYARAGKLIDQLEKDGVVGPHEGSKSRKVLMKGYDQD